MAGYKDIQNTPNANTAGFAKHPENIGKGRPLKIYTILKKQGYSKDDILTAFEELSMSTEENLEALKNDKNKPILVRITANQLQIALKNGDMVKIREIMQYTLGLPKQSVEVEEKKQQIQGITFDESE